MTGEQEHSMYLNRPDLWAVTRVMIHCKDNKYVDAAKTLWQSLDESDQEILRNLAKGIAPASWITSSEPVSNARP